MLLVSRRQFARMLAGFTAASAFAKPRSIALDAFAGSRLPHRLIVHNIDPRPAIFELRVYASHPHAMQAVLERHGIHPVLCIPSAAGTAYLFPFESLEARQRAWDAFNADQNWHALRAHSQVNVREISLYRRGRARPALPRAIDSVAVSTQAGKS